jgi:hypothetical protein
VSGRDSRVVQPFAELYARPPPETHECDTEQSDDPSDDRSRDTSRVFADDHDEGRAPCGDAQAGARAEGHGHGDRRHAVHPLGIEKRDGSAPGDEQRGVRRGHGEAQEHGARLALAPVLPRRRLPDREADAERDEDHRGDAVRHGQQQRMAGQQCRVSPKGDARVERLGERGAESDPQRRAVFAARATGELHHGDGPRQRHRTEIAERERDHARDEALDGRLHERACLAKSLPRAGGSRPPQRLAGSRGTMPNGSSSSPPRIRARA